VEVPVDALSPVVEHDQLVDKEEERHQENEWPPHVVAHFIIRAVVREKDKVRDCLGDQELVEDFNPILNVASEGFLAANVNEHKQIRNW